MVIHMVEVKCRVLRIVLASDINTSVQWSESLEIRMQHVTGISCWDSHDFHSIVWHPFDLQYERAFYTSAKARPKFLLHTHSLKRGHLANQDVVPTVSLLKRLHCECLLPPLVTRVLLSCEKQRQDVSLPCVWAPYCCIEDRTCVENEQMNPW